MKLHNFSNEPIGKLYSWLPYDLEAEDVVFFPDACPGKSPLPTGTVVFTNQDNWRKFAISDCGCGMLYCESELQAPDFDQKKWDAIYFELKQNKGKLGDLGSGNHFLDALVRYSDNRLCFLIHTGSRNESNLVDDLIEKPGAFENRFLSVCDWAADNRKAVFEVVNKYFGPLKLISDNNHNHFELTSDGVIIRKGAVKILPGEITLVPSHMSGEVVMLQAKESISSVHNSLCHGTGRTMPRSEAKKYSSTFDYNRLRDLVYIPSMISNESIKTDAPYCYRDLDDCLTLIGDLAEEIHRYKVIAYIGQI